MPKEIIRSMTLGEISAVDRPAQAPALKAIIKMQEKLGKEKVIGKSVKLTTEHLKHQHGVDTIGWEDEYLQGGTTTYAISEGDDEPHAHPWVRDENGGLVIGVALGHKHDIADLNKTAQEKLNGEKLMASKIKKSLLASAALVAGAIAKFDDTPDWGEAEAIDIAKAASEHNVEGLLPTTGAFAKAADMSNNDDEEAGKKKKLADLDAKVKKMEALADLTSVEKAHYDTLDDAGQSAFLKSDKDARSTAMEKAAGPDPVVFTTNDGTEIRKSDGSAVLAMAKRLDAKDIELAKAQVANRDIAIEKKAAEYSNLPGDIDVRKGLFGAIEDIEDEAIRKGAYAIMKAADNALDGDYTPSGAISKSDAKGAEDKLNALAKDYAKSNSVDFAKAYREVTKTEEGRDLYNEMRLGELAD